MNGSEMVMTVVVVVMVVLEGCSGARLQCWKVTGAFLYTRITAVAQ